MKRILFPWLPVLAAVLLCVVPALAEDEEALSPTVSFNCNGWNYDSGFHSRYGWANVANSALLAGENGTLIRVEAMDPYPAETVVEVYDAGFRLLSARTVPWELSYYGGFFAGEDAYYCLYGQKNPDHDDGTEVIRVVKYSKDWERLGAASFYGGNTAVPFDVGRSRFAEADGMLYLLTSRDTYPVDRKNQQSGLLLAIRERDMTVTWSSAARSPGEKGCVIKSYDQFILTAENGDLITLELSPGNLSSGKEGGLYLTRYAGAAGAEVPGEPEETILRRLITGANYTGVSLGGFAESDRCYLAVMNADGTNNGSAFRDIAVCAIDKNTFSNRIIWITDEYSNNWEVGGCSAPHLVQFSGDRFLVLWNDTAPAIGSTIDVRYQADLRYVWLDGSGEPVSEIGTGMGHLSDCVPLSLDGSAVWYTTADCEPVFYSLDPDGNMTDRVSHTPYPITLDMVSSVDPETGMIQDRRTYSGAPLYPYFSIQDQERRWTLQSGLDYTVTYADNIEPGTGSVTVTGTGHYAGTVELTFTIFRDYLSDGYVFLKETSFAWTGEEIRPEILTVMTSRGTVLDPSDYTVWYDGNVDSGLGAVVVDAVEDNLFYGQAFARFEILPPGETPLHPEDRARMCEVRAEYLYDRYASISGTLAGALGPDCYFLGAVYDAGGRLLDTVRKDNVSYQYHTFSLNMIAENAAFVQAFVVDGEGRPVCASEKLPLTEE